MKYNLSTAKFQRKQLPSGAWVINTEVMGENGEVVEASIWRDQKDGSIFPNFENLKGGDVVEGNLWTSPAGKASLYPPKASSGSSPRSTNFPAKMMEKKAEQIEHSQDRKEQAIMVASSFSSATQILVALIEKDDSYKVPDLWKEKWIEIRHWLIKNWNNTEKKMVANGVEYPQNNFPDKAPF